MIDWDKLRIFHAVAEAGSFTHAGTTLNLSQSAVSRQISSLEDVIGINLFHRHARGLMLTEEGELLYKTTRDIFARLSMIEGQLMDSKQLPEGPLRITVAHFLASTWLAPKLYQLREDHPQLQLTILANDRVLNLSMREADVALRLFKPEQPELIQKQLARIQFRLCASKKYLSKHDIPKSIKELKNHTLLGYPETVSAPFPDANWLLSVAGVDPETHTNMILMNSIHGIERAVSKGVGIAALPDYIIKANKKLDTILPEVMPKPVNLYFVYPEERRNSKRITLFRDFLLKNITNNSL